ncbi:hypothetical protein GOP47_0012268 [Adiantum capillus-veneris]|uniref:Uncharacterized protein n=1 Tax=Adiantum capillus-veneris TaxID=13818 RepID=A0A9D4URE5_ADICA|nr:hypothetical protein GOP47_0012268 [Adiantum capillus-veneris]
MNAAYSGPTYEAASDDSSSLNRKSMSLNVQAWKEKWRLQQGSRQGSLSQALGMTIPAAEMRRESRRELRKRLREELGIVQGLYSKIEARELQLKRQHSHSTGVYPALSDAQFSGNDARSTAGKEVTSSPRFVADFRARHAANGIERRSKSGKKKPDLLAQCKAILKKLMGHKDGWIFNEPVDAEKLGLADYHYFIKKPMDLGTIKARLEKRGYGSLEQFASDVRLTFDNAMTYNPPGNDVHQMAKGLRNLFEKSWNVISSKMEKQERARQLNAPSEAPRDLQEAQQVEFGAQNLQMQRPANADTAAAAKNKKPKTASKSKGSAKPKAPAKPKPTIGMSGDKKPEREMSYEEKKNLVENLQLLPALMQDEIIRLMKERNPDLSQKDDEIEVDIDSFDNETLWELDACVKNGLKSMETSKSAVGEQDQPSIDNVGVEDGLKRPDDPVQEEDIDIIGDVPKAVSPVVTAQNDAASGGNRPSSSGSSSSDSGSSSDSDSESSSSDSDVGA